MAVYVDDWRQPARVGRISDRWSHLLADREEELHEFASLLGLRRAAYQHHRHPAGNHYDVTDGLRQKAIANGAVPITWREAGRMLREARRHAGAADARPARGQPKVSGPASPPGAATASRSR